MPETLAPIHPGEHNELPDPDRVARRRNWHAEDFAAGIDARSIGFVKRGHRAVRFHEASSLETAARVVSERQIPPAFDAAL
jgi:hypothetical protein